MWRTSTKLQTLAPAWSEAQEAPLSKRRALLPVVLFDWDKVGQGEGEGEGEGEGWVSSQGQDQGWG